MRCVATESSLGPRELRSSYRTDPDVAVTGGVEWPGAGSASDGVAFRPASYTCGDTCAQRARILIRDARILAKIRRGGMAEWSMAVVLKTLGSRLSQDGYKRPAAILRNQWKFTPEF